jgi:hypothetical protein
MSCAQAERRCDGLVLLTGQWVEVDREKLRELHKKYHPRG